MVIFVGIDWAEVHHDVCVLGEAGALLTKGRVPDGVEGVARLHAMLAEHAEDPGEVLVGIETDRGRFGCMPRRCAGSAGRAPARRVLERSRSVAAAVGAPSRSLADLPPGV